MSKMAATADPPDLSEALLVNDVVARRLEEVARLLEAQGADAFRVRAWRSGASRVRQLDRSAEAILREEGIAGLERFPDIGRSGRKRVWQ
jgi:DNA polymerase/3'-5' exonuclease PolX